MDDRFTRTGRVVGDTVYSDREYEARRKELKPVFQSTRTYADALVAAGYLMPAGGPSLHLPSDGAEAAKGRGNRLQPPLTVTGLARSAARSR